MPRRKSEVDLLLNCAFHDPDIWPFYLIEQDSAGDRVLLTGEKVVLRGLERDDLKLLHKWQNDEEVMRLARSFPDHAISMVALEAKYERMLKGEDSAERDYIIEEKAGKKPLGWAGIRIHQWPPTRATGADVGLAIGEREFREKGFGTDVIELLLREAFEQLNLHKVVWWTFAENTASLALAGKLGFREECRVRDSVFFDNQFHDSIGLGLLKNEYEAAKGRASKAKTRS